jgi:hypothetical protein
MGAIVGSFELRYRYIVVSIHDKTIAWVSGVNVMITIFCDFGQFLAKNGVFLKNQCYDQKGIHM